MRNTFFKYGMDVEILKITKTIQQLIHRNHSNKLSFHLSLKKKDNKLMNMAQPLLNKQQELRMKSIT